MFVGCRYVWEALARIPTYLHENLQSNVRDVACFLQPLPHTVIIWERRIWRDGFEILGGDVTKGTFTVSIDGRETTRATVLFAGAVLWDDRIQLGMGTVVEPGDLRMSRRPLDRLSGAVARRADQAVGMQLRQMVPAGAPFVLASLRPPVLVRKGAAVLIRIDRPGIALTAEGRALEPGGAGDAIRVLNPLSHAVLRARVIATGEVRVAPDAPPLVPAGGVVPSGMVPGGVVR